MRRRQKLLSVVILGSVVASAGGVAAAVGVHMRSRAGVDAQVLDSMNRLSESSAPQPRTSDTRLGDGRFRSEESCSAVQASYGGTLTTSTFGWVASVALPTGPAAVIGAPAETGCAYELTNIESIELLGVGAPGFDRFRAFANVACSWALIPGAFGEFIGPDGNPAVLIIAGDASLMGFGQDESAPTTTAATIRADQQGTLALFSGRYSPKGDGMTQLASLEGTIVDQGNGFVFTAGDVRVSARCTPVDPAALVPTIDS